MFIVVLAGTSEGFAGPRVLIRVVTPCDLAESILVEIFHYGEGGNVEQVARTSKQFSRVCDCLSLSITHLCLYILHAHIIISSYLYMLDITCVQLIYTCLGLNNYLILFTCFT